MRLPFGSAPVVALLHAVAAGALADAVFVVWRVLRFTDTTMDVVLCTYVGDANDVHGMRRFRLYDRGFSVLHCPARAGGR